MPPQQMMGQFGGGIGCQQQMQPPMHCSSRCSLLSPTGASSIAAAASAAASATAAACNDRRCFLMCAEIVQKGRPFSCMVFTCYGCWKREQGRGGMLDLVLLTSNHMLRLTNENENEASFSFSSRTITFNFYRNFFVHMSTHTRKNESFSSSNRKKRPQGHNKK